MIIRFQCVHDLSCVAGNGDALSSAASYAQKKNLHERVYAQSKGLI